jgi:hypothetical protein
MGGVLYEVGPDGRLFVASDFGDEEEGVERAYYRRINADINFEEVESVTEVSGCYSSKKTEEGLGNVR